MLAVLCCADRRHAIYRVVPRPGCNCMLGCVWQFTSEHLSPKSNVVTKKSPSSFQWDVMCEVDKTLKTGLSFPAFAPIMVFTAVPMCAMLTTWHIGTWTYESLCTVGKNRSLWQWAVGQCLKVHHRPPDSLPTFCSLEMRSVIRFSASVFQRLRAVFVFPLVRLQLVSPQMCMKHSYLRPFSASYWIMSTRCPPDLRRKL